MRITKLAKRLGVLPDEIRWFEAKGYVEPSWRVLKNRRVRDYTEEDVRKIELIVKYRRQGFEHEAAYERAIKELRSPRLVP